MGIALLQKILLQLPGEALAALLGFFMGRDLFPWILDPPDPSLLAPVREDQVFWAS